MHMTFVKGDILKDGADVLVNPVNCVGVMGAGLALQFKKKYPYNFQVYYQACKNKELKPGKILTYWESGSPINENYSDILTCIANFPTKNHWRNPSKIEYIKDGLTALIDFCLEKNIKSIAIPKLGCGLGGLHWDEVCKLIKEAFKVTTCIVRVYGEER